jgi:hypothetical protein
MLRPPAFEASAAFAAVALGDCAAAVFAAVPRAGERPFAAALAEELAVAAAFVAELSELARAAELSEEPEDGPREVAEEDLWAAESEPFAAGLEDLLVDELLFVELLLLPLVAARSREKISLLEELAELERFAFDDELLDEELPILSATSHQSISPRMQ